MLTGGLLGIHDAWAYKPVNSNIILGGWLNFDKAGFLIPYVPGDWELVWLLPWSYKTEKMPSAKIFIDADRQQMRNIGNKFSDVSKQGLSVERTLP